MGKRKAKAVAAGSRSKQQQGSADSKPNLFERLYNRKKFDILGKKAKGERKHGQSVHDAVEKVCIQTESLDDYRSIAYHVCYGLPEQAASL